MAGKASQPVIQRTLRYGECDRAYLPRPLTPLGSIRPDKESQDSTAMPQFISIIQVIGIRRIKVDCLLDQAQAQQARAKIDVLLCITTDGRDMVDARDNATHEFLQFIDACLKTLFCLQRAYCKHNTLSVIESMQQKVQAGLLESRSDWRQPSHPR